MQSSSCHLAPAGPAQSAQGLPNKPMRPTPPKIRVQGKLLMDKCCSAWGHGLYHPFLRGEFKTAKLVVKSRKRKGLQCDHNGERENRSGDAPSGPLLVVLKRDESLNRGQGVYTSKLSQVRCGSPNY